MKTPNLWQKLVAGFKKPFQQIRRKRDHTPRPTEDTFFRESGESVYHQYKDARKLRKRKKRTENKSRAVNAQKNKTWKR